MRCLRLVCVLGFTVLTSCGKPKSTSVQVPPDASSPANSERCQTLDLPIEGPATCPPSTQQLDLQSVCNEPNFATTVVAACSLDQNFNGTWTSAGLSGQHLVATFACQGVSDCDDCWSCSTQTISLTLTDGTSMAFIGKDGSDLRGLELDHCAPPFFDVALPNSNGGYAALALKIPTAGFIAGAHPIQDGAAYDYEGEPTVTEVGASMASSSGQPAHSVGHITGGQIVFTATTLDPNQKLAFSVDGNLAMPAANTQEDLFHVYCGDPHALYAGQWMVLISANP